MIIKQSYSFKIGALCMTIVEHELQRHDAWKEELVKHKSKNILSLKPNYYSLKLLNIVTN